MTTKTTTYSVAMNKTPLNVVPNKCLSERVFAIYFDMDGTIADLYGVPNWCAQLEAKKATPYEKAAPLVPPGEFVKRLKKLEKLGAHIGIVSWLAKGELSKEYKKEITEAKKKWNREIIGFNFHEQHYVQYGTRKDYVVKYKNSIIFDDDENVRKRWRGIAINPKEQNIICVLDKIISMFF